MSYGRLGRIDSRSRARIDEACAAVNVVLATYRRRVVIIAIVALGIGVAIAVAVQHPWPMIGAIVVMAVASGIAQSSVTDMYKERVVKPVVAVLDGFEFNPESSFTLDDFLTMDLYGATAEKLSSEDELRGRKGDVTYALHECKATYTTGSGKNRRTVVVFKGVIARVDFHKRFAGHAVVVPNAESQILGGLFGESDSRRGKTLARMENPTFEEEFSVYATDDQQARYILTPKMMELILESKMNVSDRIRMSFLANSVYVTIPQAKNRFEASLFGGAITAESVLGDLMEIVGLAERLIETLDLETRIWSRT